MTTTLEATSPYLNRPPRTLAEYDAACTERLSRAGDGDKSAMRAATGRYVVEVRAPDGRVLKSFEVTRRLIDLLPDNDDVRASYVLMEAEGFFCAR